MTKILLEISDENISYKEWKRVNHNDRKQRTKLIDCEKDKDERKQLV